MPVVKTKDKAELSKLNGEIEELGEKLTKKLAAGQYEEAEKIEGNLDHLRRAVGHRRRHMRLALEAVHKKERERLNGEIAGLDSELAGLADQSLASERAIATLRTMIHALTLRMDGSGAPLRAWMPGEDFTRQWSVEAEELLPEKVKELCGVLDVILKNPVDIEGEKNIRRRMTVLGSHKGKLYAEIGEIGVTDETDQ